MTESIRLQEKPAFQGRDGAPEWFILWTSTCQIIWHQASVYNYLAVQNGTTGLPQTHESNPHTLKQFASLGKRKRKKRGATNPEAIFERLLSPDRQRNKTPRPRGGWSVEWPWESSFITWPQGKFGSLIRKHPMASFWMSSTGKCLENTKRKKQTPALEESIT